MPLCYRTLIVDDEYLARERLKKLLKEFPERFDIIGESSNGDEAFKSIEKYNPDIVFLDIQMPGKDVFELLSEVNNKPLIVFCTAYDEYALKAFESLAIDYLLKPIERERLLNTINKLDRLDNGFHLPDLIRKITATSNKSYPTSIPYKLGERILLIKLSDVTYFRADNKYVNFYNIESKEYLTDQTLNNLEVKLPPEFIRISKSMLVNSTFVTEIHKFIRGKFIIVLNDLKRTKLETGSTYYDQIKTKFDI